MAVPQQRAWIIFGVVALALFMSTLDATIVVIAIPAMLQDLKTNLAWLAWVLTGYTLAQTIIMPVSGKLSDEWGRKRLFLAAAALFTVGSAASGLAPNVYALILFRVLQGIGGGVFLPSATGIVSDAFGERRATAVGLFMSIFPLGALLGPNIGGFIVDHASWRWVFYVNIPIGSVLVLVGMFMLPADRRAGSRQRIDLVGIALFAAGLSAVIYAMTDWANHPQDLTNPRIWAFLLIGLCVLTGFLWHEARTAAPVIELTLLRWRPFLAANTYGFLYGAVVYGFTSFVPYYATVAYGMSAGEDGLILTPRSLLIAGTSMVSSFVLIRLGYRRPMLIGVVSMSASILLLSRGFRDVSIAGHAVPNLILLMAMLLLYGFGVGIAGPAANNAALDLLPERVAAVAGLRGMFQSTGGVLGTAAVPLALSRFANETAGLQTTYFVLSLALLGLIPIIFLIPDTARGRRMAAANELRQVEAGG